MKKELIEIIEYHIENKRLLNVERHDISENEKINGFPVILTNDYLLMTNIYDFHDEGYVLIRVCDITNAYSYEDEVFFESICIREKLQEKVHECPITEIKDIKSLLTNVEQGRYITIRCENETKKCNFFLGKMQAISEDVVEFISLGVDGKWNSEIDSINFSEITMIAFDDYYAKMFYKYTENS